MAGVCAPMMLLIEYPIEMPLIADFGVEQFAEQRRLRAEDGRDAEPCHQDRQEHEPWHWRC